MPVGEAGLMASAHDTHDSHDSHDSHGHDDHGAVSSTWVIPPLVIGVIIGIVLLAVLGLATGAPSAI